MIYRPVIGPGNISVQSWSTDLWLAQVILVNSHDLQTCDRRDRPRLYLSDKQFVKSTVFYGCQVKFLFYCLLHIMDIMCLSSDLSLCLSFFLSFFLTNCLSVFLVNCLSVCLVNCLSVCLMHCIVNLSVCLLCFSNSLSAKLFGFLSYCLFVVWTVCLWVCIYVWACENCI